MSGRSGGAPRVEEIGRDGLAIQIVGSGPPLFLVPNPQGFVLSAASHSPLAETLASLGRSVLTFDPPGAFASTRPPRLRLDEMIECCLEALQVAGLREPVDAVAHSQGTVVALALAIRHPELLRRLVLVGAVDGGVKATRRAGGLPWGWSALDRRLWRFAWLGSKLSAGRGSLADFKSLARLVQEASFVDASLVPRIVIEPGDLRRPGPRRAGWQASIRGLDLLPQLGRVKAPTLVCVGRHDPQTPVRGNAEIAKSVADGRLAVFDRSGHSPFLEEPGRFQAVVGEFLDTRT